LTFINHHYYVECIVDVCDVVMFFSALAFLIFHKTLIDKGICVHFN